MSNKSDVGYVPGCGEEENRAGGRGGAHPPHVVAMPCPLHGHITPFLGLCDVLSGRWGIAITIVVTPRYKPMVERHIATRSGSMIGEHHGSANRRGFEMALLAGDGLPEDYSISVDDLPTYLRHVEKLEGQLRSLVGEMVNGPLHRRPACILSDSHLGWVQNIADELRLPRICFLTSSVVEFTVLFHQPFLLSQGLLPFTRGLDQVISCIPGVPPTRCTDFPSFMQVEDVTDYEFQYFMRQVTRVADAERLLVASFDDLEPRVIEALSKRLRVQAVGPVILQGKEEEEAPTGLLPNTTDDPLQQWLDKQELNSVIYIAFGSLANLTLEEVHAIAYGLVQSKQPFIWALREGTVPNIVDPLPRDFRQSTKAQGLVVKWAQQRQILKHPAIAAFLSHCGWGSSLESICMGVPLVCWPLYGDQLLNCNLLVDQWQAGIRLAPSLPNRRKSLTPEHVESAIVTIINSPAYRSNMIKLQTLAKKACHANGKSANNLRDLVHDLYALAETVHPQG